METGAHELTVTGDLLATAAASAWIRALGSRHGFPAGDLFRLDLCVTEVVSNVAVHGYGGRAGGPVVLHAIPVDDGNGIRVDVIDDGAAFDPLTVSPPPAPTRAADAPVGGLGVHLIRAHADECRYERRDDRNVFTFLVYRSPIAADGSADAHGRVNRSTDRRRQAAAPVFPVTRGDGSIAARDERSGNERRLLGFISSCDLFRGVPYALVEDVIAHCTVRDLDEGAVLLHPGDRNHYLVIVVRGRLKVQLGTADMADFMEIVAGECTGEMSVIDGKPVSAHVVAASQCRILMIDSDTFLTRILSVPEVARNLVALLAERMRRSNTRIIDRMRSTIELDGLQRELNFAHEVQASLVPASMVLSPARPQLQCCGSMRPARQVGGDFYDAFYLDSNRLAIMTGDVCGKGMPAALFMARAMTLLRSEAMRFIGRTQRGHTLEWVASANQQLCEHNHAGYFASAFVAILDATTGLLTWINAGHPAPALARGSSRFEFVNEPRSVLLGVDPAARYTVGETALPPGSTLLVYSDGVTEAEDPDRAMFGEERLLALLNDSRSRDAGNVIESTVAAVDAYTRGHPQSDDLTLLALRYHGAG